MVNVHVPKDKLTQQHMGFGFVEFKTEQDAEYAIKVRAVIADCMRHWRRSPLGRHRFST